MKKISILLVLVMLANVLVAVPSFAQPANDKITVLFNGEKMVFDVDPVLINDRTMVPMRAIFEALGCVVSWDDASQQAIGFKNGKKVVVAIGNNTAFVNGEFKEIDQPPVLMNDRTLVPLRFVSEAYDCKVDWDDATQTVTITEDNNTLVHNLDALSFGETGDWARDGSALKGRTTRDAFWEQGITDIPVDESAIAKANVQFTRSGKYRIWVLARDYKTNQQGSRFFTISVDDQVSEKTFGQHGQEGFVWEDAGVFDVSEGKHQIKLIDTSAFFARCNGVFITSDLNFNPADYGDALAEQYPTNPSVPTAPISIYPTWTKQEMPVSKTDSIENDAYKIEFYQGESVNGPLVQTAIYTKDNGAWVKVKDRSDDFVYILQYAKSSKYSTTVNYEYVASTVIDYSGETVNVSTDHLYDMAPISWCIPVDYKVIDDKKVEVYFTNEFADLKATFAFDEVEVEPQVTADATFKKDGAYSFIFHNGDGVAYEDFDTVTAPLLFVKHGLPSKPLVITEPFMFTPMNTLYYKAERNKAGNGKEFTSGLVVDPTVVRQGFSYPETAEYATTFYTFDNQIRPHLIAPVLGDNSNFKAGDTYSFKFRLLNDFKYWYDTFTHIATDMYDVADIRDNYYTSYNEAIYNATELWLDDLYGGWDDKAMSYYNMEAKDVTTQADPLEAAQRYMLTDDLTILEERTVPTIAYMLSRKNMSFQYTAEAGGLTSSYIKTEIPSPIGSPVDYSAGVYGGLYEMTQGRMPFLLEHAINGANGSEIASLSALYKYTGDEGYYNLLLMKADDYLEKTSCMSGDNYNKMFTTGFVYTDYARLLNTLLLAYEYTGEQKYLDAADKAGQLTMTSTWSTGYHNGNDFNTFHIDNETMGQRPHPHDGNKSFFWHGSQQWRLGNVYGESKAASELGLEIPEEDVPGWLPAQAGLGTEHPYTPKFGAINQLNVWAGSIMRLARYTGDDYYVTQARNAMIGRFGNYSGYGRERYIVHNQHPDFPYKGPDYVTLYYHHIPVFMGMLEDYLINDIWYRSDANIEFPMVFQQGYAYFDMNRYGQEPGKFYDEQDMWLWITPDVVSPDNRSVDYIAARKEGTLGVALVNEKTEPVTTTVTLGSKVENASAINGTATLYDAKGNKSEVQVTNGVFTVTIPAKGIQSVVIKTDGVHNPSYAREYKYSTQLGQTVSEHTNGKGYVIQLSDEMYHAYTYVTDKDLKQLEITYTADGQTVTKTCDSYPFEFIVKVNNVNSDFTYSLKATKADGTVVDMGSGLLRTIDNSEGVDPNAGVVVTSGSYYSSDGTSVYTREETNAPDFAPTQAKINRIGRASEGWKFIVEKDTFPFEITQANVGDLVNIGVVMHWSHKREGKIIDAASYVVKAELADDGKRVALCVTPTFALPSAVYSFDNADYNITMDVYHDSPTDAKIGITTYEFVEEKLEFEPTEIKINTRGRDGTNWRFVASNDAFPFEVKADNMIGLKVYAIFTHKNGEDVRVLESTVKTNDIRADGASTTLVVPATDIVPMKTANGTVFDDAPYDVKFILAPKDYAGKIDLPENAATTPPAGEQKKPEAAVPELKFDAFEAEITTRGRDSENWRFVIANDQFPFDVTEGCMAGLAVKAVYTHKNTKEKLVLLNNVKTNQMRDDGVSTTLVVPATKEVPIRTPDGEVFDDAPYTVKLYIAPVGHQFK
ncbi:MAG: hypothetical protein IJE10_02065 [Clostridia bacterium]|nr:hypothetical protein [Clostridia bacterium]